jgi:hypothetical protein
MMRRDRNFRPAMTNGWLVDDIASNLRNNAGLSSSEAAQRHHHYFLRERGDLVGRSGFDAPGS